MITGLLGEERTQHTGAHYNLVDAPLAPKPVQTKVPLLIGGKGEQRTMRIAARYADEWNCWGEPEFMAAKVEVLAARCAEIDRDPAEIHVSTQALLMLSHDDDWLAKMRGRDFGQATIVGSPAEVIEAMVAYADAGVDEFIVSDFTFGPMNRKLETMELFMTEVGPHC